MLACKEFDETILIHALVPTGPIPTIEDPEGIYPYESYCETAKRPELRKFRFVSIENEFLLIAVCPDLGGKVHSIFDKQAKKEILFQPGSVRPARILPRMAFISGGIEVSFPVSHTPVQLERVHYRVEQRGDRVYIWCGEQEVRYGMQWTVEYSLGVADRYLCQRTLFYNPTSGEHPWMSWSNAALPARPDTELHFPSGEVLYHGDELRTLDFGVEGPKTMSQIDRMAGFFWNRATYNAFGVFTPSLGTGLYHIASPREVPGIKLWVYGRGKHEAWAHLSNIEKSSYLEIQAGPIRDQSMKHSLSPGERHIHTEFWIPSCEPLNIYQMTIPQATLTPHENMPLFGYVERTNIHVWLQLVDAYWSLDVGKLPSPPDYTTNHWPPSGMEDLGDAIRWARSVSESDDQERWGYYLGVWFAAKGQKEQALQTLDTVECDLARILEARLFRCWYNNPRAAVRSLERIQSKAIALHPQVVIERDIVLSLIQGTFAKERTQWLNQVSSLPDDGLLERKISLLVDMGDVKQANELLASCKFEPVHQRYERSLLWRQIQEELHLPTEEPPENLGEDDLAEFGLYRVNDASPRPKETG